MEQEPGSPVAGKAEEHAGSLLLTYFQGDINSMVDAHFSRALAKVTTPREGHTKSKKTHKSTQSKESNLSHWNVQSHMNLGTTDSLERLELGRYKETPVNLRLPLNTPAQSSSVWLSGPRQAPGLVLPPMMYPTASSADGLMVADHQYTNSLLNLLHSERPELGSVMVASPKQEFTSDWARHSGLGDQMTLDHSLDLTGVQMMEKKDLYWY